MPLRVISLYTGVGGLDFGFEAAGFEVAAAVEQDRICRKTLALNRPDWPLAEERDIHDVTSGDLLALAEIQAGDADVLIGGPPCQPFSKSGYWAQKRREGRFDTARLDDPRSDTLQAFMRVLRDTQPKAFLLENVKGLSFRGKSEGLKYLLEELKRINRMTGSQYHVEPQTLNAADYGVPQLRERVFLIGARDGARFEFPRPTHTPANSPSSPGDRLQPHHTTWDALGDLPERLNDPELMVNGKWGALLPTIPEGENYLWHTSRGGGKPLFGWRTRYWSFLLKLAKDRPSWTIQAQPGTAIGPFHWTSRRLSAQELSRLQTFPHGLEFECGRSQIQKMIGNAVPSLLAEILAWEIKFQLLGVKRRKVKYRLMPVARGTPPAPERVARLPKQYKDLVGHHPDHPGEGRGPGYDTA